MLFKLLGFLSVNIIFCFVFVTHSFAQVTINEISPFVNPEWVEFYNASSSAEYIKSYYIDDDDNFSSDDNTQGIRSLSNLNTDNIAYPYVETSSFFNNGLNRNNEVDTVTLFDQYGTKIDSYAYSVDYEGLTTFGRYPDGSGSLIILESATKGAANAGPQPSPTPTSTPDPTPTPNPTASPNPTATPKSSSNNISKPKSSPQSSTKKASATPSLINETEKEDEGFVLGTSDKENTDEKKDEQNEDKEATASDTSNIPVGIFFVIGGLLVSGSGGYIAYKYQLKKDQNSK